MPRLTDHDRDELARFSEFLRRTGMGPMGRVRTPEGQARLRAWIAEDPEARLAYLGLPNTPEWQEIRAELLAEGKPEEAMEATDAKS